jgi:hypothetical protein
MSKYAGLSLEQRFWKFVEKSDGCWLWTGQRTPEGYGRFVVGRTPKQKGFNKGAHRFSWEMEYGGPIPVGIYVCHGCDQPSCVRPSHLFLGTATENMRDMARKGRGYRQNAPTCRRGHAFDAANTYRRGQRRHCRACNLIATWKKRGKPWCESGTRDARDKERGA